MPSSLIDGLSSYGPAGIAIAVLVWYIVRRESEHKAEVLALRTELSNVQEKRVAASQSVTEKLLEITERWHTVIADLTNALKEHRSAVDRLAESRKGNPR